MRSRRWITTACCLGIAGCTSASPEPYAPADPQLRDPQRALELQREADEIAAAGDFEEAEALYRRALSHDLYCGPAHNNLGVLSLEQDRLYKAAGEFDWARRLMPGHPDPRFNLGLTLEAAGHVREAMDAYRTALEVSPGHVATRQAMAMLSVDQGAVDDEVLAQLRSLSLEGESATWREWAEAQSARWSPAHQERQDLDEKEIEEKLRIPDDPDSSPELPQPPSP